jgi:hypothetical protein
LGTDDVGLLLLMLRSYLRKQKKIPSSVANPIIGMATIRAILPFPRFPLNQPLLETAAEVLEPSPVEFFEGGGEELVEEGLLVGDEPEL